jgi:serine/threonine-protein kinase
MISVASLMDALRHGPLLPPEHLREAERLATTLPTANAVLDELVQRNWLTAYQRKELAAGRGFGLALGPHVLLEKLGRGGFGEVFRARHQIIGRVVALKRMKEEALDCPDFAERFLREARAAGQLSHANVVQVFDAGDADGTLYLTMEFVPGVDLEKYLQQRGALPVDEAIEYVRQACVGMQHAHDRGIIHRDLKPANLMRTDEGTIKVLDLGLALIATERTLTQTRIGMGTPEYGAPEQWASAHRVDGRADVYSLGCVLYHALAGRKPFSFAGMLPQEWVVLVQTQEPTPLEQRRDDVPPGVCDAVRKMMAKKREDRFQTPGEAATVLESLLTEASQGSRRPAATPASEGVSGPPSDDVPTTKPPAPRRSQVEATPGRSATGLREFENSIGMRFVLVEPGTFLMGSPEDEEDRSEDETQHEVTITKPFYLAVCPVTQRQWKAVMGSNPSYFSRTGDGKKWVRDVSDAELDLFPVECVSWEDAQEFLTKLAALDEEGRDGLEYRLPSEAEWEYACRGGHLIQEIGDGHTLPFHFDRPYPSLSSAQANFDGNHPYGGAAEGPYLKRPSNVGSYEPNALGLCDTHGNIGEWCLDWYARYLAGRVSDPSGPPHGTSRVYRGGNWHYGGVRCRAAYRGRYAPVFRDDYVGFRVAAGPSSSKGGGRGPGAEAGGATGGSDEAKRAGRPAPSPTPPAPR